MKPNKIKLIAFDLDGVLVSTKELHFEALNRALEKIDSQYSISQEEHLSIYDGLPTKTKLELLNERKKLPKALNSVVWDLKQQITEDMLKDSVKNDLKLSNIFSSLWLLGYKLAVVTNSIRSTTNTILEKLGISAWVHLVITNQEVTNPKPNPEMYLRTMVAFSVCPHETLIVEDSVHGVTAATNSGGNVLQVSNTNELTLDLVLKKIGLIESQGKMKKINKPNLTLLIPCAGAGSRFEKAGYTFPKPLIEIHGKAMIQVVVDSLSIEANYVYIVQKSHYDKYSLRYLLNSITPNCQIICIDKLTEGAACTTLLAKDFIDNDKELFIVNSDQYIEWNPLEFFYLMQNQNVDGGILTFNNQHPKWSYVKLDDLGFVTEVAEKRVISNLATVGAYAWKRGSDYVKYAEQMIRKNIRINNEFYVAPVTNEAILDGKKFKTYQVEKMYGLGTPEDLEDFKRAFKL